MDIRNAVGKMKADSPKMAALSLETRNQALKAAALALQEHREEIFQANRKDMEAAQTAGVLPSVMKRLKFDEEKLKAVIEGMEQLIKLPDPLSKIQLARKLDENLELYRVTCPFSTDFFSLYQKRKLCCIKRWKRNSTNK